jgi:hypothetical protein
MKCDISLKVSALKTDIRLIKKCKDKNEIKKSPERAIATFLAMDDFNIVDFDISKLE